MIRLKQTPADQLAFQLRYGGAPPFEREYRVSPRRKFRCDFYFAAPQLVVEIDGGGWISGGGHHSRGQGMEDDCEKSALIAAMPSRLIRVTPRQVRDGRALQWILTACPPPHTAQTTAPRPGGEARSTFGSEKTKSARR